MPAYAYRAKDEHGRTRSGVVDAPDELAADASLRGEGLYVLAVAEAAPAPVPPPRRLSRRELIMFTVQLATLLRAGIPLNTGLADFARDSRGPRLAAVARHVLASLEGGAMLSEAMARLPATFPEVYVAVIRAGETTGHLDRVLFDLVESLEWQETIRRQVRQATIYPALVLIAFAGLLTFLLLFVFPRFKAMFDRLRVPLPLPTRVLLTAADVLAAYWATLLLVVVAVVVGYRLAVSTPGGRLLVDGWKLRLPAIGPVLRNVALARFAHHMETLQRAGVNFVLALDVLERVMGNVAIARAVGLVRQQVITGMSFADALASTGQFPPLVLRMVATGELSGSLEETLHKVGEYYDREVPDTVRRFLAFLEPALIALLAAVVLGAMLAVYLPIYSLITTVRTRPGAR
jgi:type II secretory pathway component PulF